ncbi:Putative phospholipase B-like 2 [Chamberlinius hualienensis]
MNTMKYFVVVFLFTLACILFVTSYELESVSVLWNPITNNFKIVENEKVPGCVAWATFDDSTNETGWSFLRVVTNERFPDTVQAYAAGLAEGRLTGKQMRYFWDSYVKMVCDPSTGSSIDLCNKVWQFMRTNMKWMRFHTGLYATIDPYWHQVDLMLRQIEGIQDGCEDKSFIIEPGNFLFEEFGFMLFTFNIDVSYGLLDKFNATLERSNDHPMPCSALIKPLLNNTDLYVSHVSWNWYSSMVRVLKNYEFYYHYTDFPRSSIVSGFNITFSSYPGAIQSIDDYYLISSGLTTLETTLNIYNDSLLEYIQPQSVLEGFRVMLANRLAADGETWVDLFTKYHSGTYTNEWMIVNYNLFKPGAETLSDGLLIVVEEMPGYWKAADVTSVLRDQGYWASYNVPYFEEIFNISGAQNKLKKFGPIFGSYDGNYRALIFKREQSKVVDLETMINVMRFNDYENDPFSICPNCTPQHNAMMAISARNDLNPANGTYIPSGTRHLPIGGIDMKLTNYSMFSTLQFIAIGGPTYETVPPFCWSTYESNGEEIEHPGQPDLWNFDPVLTVWN